MLEQECRIPSLGRDRLAWSNQPNHVPLAIVTTCQVGDNRIQEQARTTTLNSFPQIGEDRTTLGRRALPSQMRVLGFEVFPKVGAKDWFRDPSKAIEIPSRLFIEGFSLHET